jgi:hypothetical protein
VREWKPFLERDQGGRTPDQARLGGGCGSHASILEDHEPQDRGDGAPGESERQPPIDPRQGAEVPTLGMDREARAKPAAELDLPSITVGDQQRFGAWITE